MEIKHIEEYVVEVGEYITFFGKTPLGLKTALQFATIAKNLKSGDKWAEVHLSVKSTWYTDGVENYVTVISLDDLLECVDTIVVN